MSKSPELREANLEGKEEKLERLETNLGVQIYARTPSKYTSKATQMKPVLQGLLCDAPYLYKFLPFGDGSKT